MNKFPVWFICAIALLTYTLPLHAQSGCQNSPENPTAVLALVGSAGAVLASIRARMKSRTK